MSHRLKTFLVLAVLAIQTDSISSEHAQVESRTFRRKFDNDPSALCLSKSEVASCHRAGTDFNMLASNQDNRCRSADSQPKVTDARLAFAKPIQTKQCPCKPNYSGLKCETCTDGYHLKFQHSPPTSPGVDSLASSGHLSEIANTTKMTNMPQNASESLMLAGLKQSRYFVCKPCNCDPLGSKSHVCDKRNGTCFCVDGHTGSKCDRCALGYYNSSLVASSQRILETSSVSQVNSSTFQVAARQVQTKPCVECGHCFNQWHIAIMDLKDTSLDMIKRTHELSQSLTSSLGVQAFTPSETGETGDGPDNGTARLILNGTHNSFNGLDEKISVIGQRVLENKYRSDRLRLFASELDSCIENCAEITSALMMRNTRHRNITLSLSDLKRTLAMTIADLHELSRLIDDKFKHLLEDLQENLPRGAHKLILRHARRSEVAALECAQAKSRFQTEFGGIRPDLALKLELLRKSQNKLDEFGREHLAKTLIAHQMNFSSPHDDEFVQSVGSSLWPFAVNKIDSPYRQTNAYFEELERNYKLAESLVHEANNSAIAFVSNSTSREADFEAIQKILIDSQVAINQTEIMIERLDANMTSMMRNIATFNNSDSCDFLQVIHNNTQAVRTNLDKLDAKWTTTQLELTDLLRLNSTSEIAEQMFSLTHDINQTLRILSPKSTAFFDQIAMDLEETHDLMMQSKTLMSEADELGERLHSIGRVRSETSSLLDDTRSLNKMTHNETAKLFNQINSTSTIATKILSDSNDRDRVKGLADRLGRIQVHSMVDALDKKRLIREHIISLNTSNSINAYLLEELKGTYQEVASCLASVVGNDTNLKPSNQPASTNELEIAARVGINLDDKHSAPASKPAELAASSILAAQPALSSTRNSYNSSDRANLVRQRGRLVNLLAGFESITRLLHRSMVRTKDLREEFSSNAKVFGRQNRILKYLHVEIDHLNADIRSKLNDYSCE